MNEPKFQVGDTVYILNERCEVKAIQNDNGVYSYRVTNAVKPFWHAARWFERVLVSEGNWHTRQAEIVEQTRQRQEWDRQRYNELLDLEPVRNLFDTEIEFEEVYCRWAESFWGCGDDMPYSVRYTYNRFMLKNRFVFRS